MKFAKAVGFAALVFTLLALPGIASSEVFARFELVNGNPSVYESELVQLNLVVLNNSSLPAKNIALSAYTDPNLSLVLGNGTQAKKIEFAVSELKPGQRETRAVQVLGLKPSSSSQKIYLDYSDSNASYSSSLSMLVLKSPVSLNAKLASNPVSAGEKSRAIISIKNSSGSEISDVFASLGVPDGIIAGKGISFPKLGAGESLSERELLFEASKSAQGEYPIMVRAGFSDSSGNHVLQKQLNLRIGLGLPITLIILILLFLFVLGAFVFSGKRARKQTVSRAEAEEIAEQELPAPEQKPKPKPKPAPKPKEKGKAKEKKK